MPETIPSTFHPREEKKNKKELEVRKTLFGFIQNKILRPS